MLTIFLAISSLFNNVLTPINNSDDSHFFVPMFYRQIGIDLPFDLEEQLICQDFIPVSLDQLQPGDLLFLGKKDKAETVGLYLGNEVFIYANPSEQASLKVETLKDSDWSYCKGHTLKIDHFEIDCSHQERFDVFLDCPQNFEPFKCYFINEERIPLVVSPIDPNISLETFSQWIELYKEDLKSLISDHGALLLRDFPVLNAQDFSSIVNIALGKPLDYKGEGSRTKVADGVYTSTEAPPNFQIPLHNELTCTNTPPSFFCLYCNIAPKPGTGQTILGKTANITHAFKNLPAIWNLFENKNMRYISRHPSRGSLFTKINKTHKVWQDAFETEDKSEVERICQDNGFEFQWTGEWIEVIRTVPAIRGSDNHFNFPYWFNQVHLYHSNPRLCDGKVNYLLYNLVYAQHFTRPYDIEFEDGSQIPREIIYQIYDTLEENTIKFDWKNQDVLILDNFKTLHGRAPYKGPRRILVSFVQ